MAPKAIEKVDFAPIGGGNQAGDICGNNIRFTYSSLAKFFKNDVKI